MRKIKVVFGINDFLVGGMQRQLSRQVPHFDREKFEIILVTLFKFPERPTLYADLPDDITVYQLAFKGWWDIGEWRKVYRLLRTLKPDIVVSSLFFANTVFRLLKPAVGYASIAREHNTYLNKPLPQKVVDKILSFVSVRIVAVSRTVAEFTSRQERIPISKFTVIHNGIDIAEVDQKLTSLPGKEVLRQELALESQDMVILNIARLSEQKNHKLLIEGFGQFLTHHPNAKLLLVGEGGMRQKLESQVKKARLEHSVKLFGMREDVWRFYKAADVFASTSSIEGLSNAYLEALAAGLPLVSTLTAGTDELLVEGKNGSVIEAQTPHAVARALERACSVGAALLGVGARKSVEKFSIRQTVKEYETLFTKITD